MGYESCLSAIRKAASEALTDDDLEEILSEIVRRKNLRMKTNPLEDERAAFTKAAEELSQDEKIAAQIEKRNRGLNILARDKRASFYGTTGRGESFNLSTLNVGSERTGQGFGLSVDAQYQGLRSGLFGPMMAEIRQAGLLSVLSKRDAQFDRNVAREMWRLSDGGEPTGDKHALKAAEILAKYQEQVRVMQNEAGAFIGRMPGYVVRQAHDMFRTRAAGLEQWKQTIIPLLDETTFADTKDRDGFLTKVFNDLASGNHLKATGSSDWLGGFKGPGNLAKRVSQERVLHFKDADSWFDYNEKFGTSSLFEAAMFGLDRGARNTALMRTWGTNPEAAFQADLDRLTLQAKDRGDLKEVERLSSWRIKAEFDQLTGAANIPANPSTANIMANIRAVQSMAKLGGVVLSSLPDIALRAATLRHNGVGLLESYASSLKTLFEGRSSGERREIADLLGAGFDGILGNVLSRFSATDDVRGRMSKTMNLFFRANLLNWWTDSNMTGAALMLSRNLARNTGNAFDALPGSLRGNLTRFGIDQKAWDAVRKAGLRETETGSYIVPDAIRGLSKDDLGGLDAGELETALRSYFIETTREANTFPGARERALVNLGTQKGTAVGEAMRFVMQFRTFPITFATRHLARELKRDGFDKTGLAHLIVATTVLGYLSQSAKEIAKGRTPRDPASPKTWLAAMQQGGGLGIYGDFLFGEYNRFGGGFAETLAGPAAGSAGEIASIFAAIRGEIVEPEKKHDIGAKAVRAAIGNAPFANLFYTRMALDYLVLFQVQEMMNPGYLRRFEQRVQKENGQRFIIKPSEAIPRGGGNRLLEGLR